MRATFALVQPSSERRERLTDQYVSAGRALLCMPACEVWGAPLVEGLGETEGGSYAPTDCATEVIVGRCVVQKPPADTSRVRLRTGSFGF